MAIKTAIIDQRAGLDEENRVLSVSGFSAGSPGREANLVGSPDYIGFFEDFNGATLPVDWTYTEGTDTATAGNAVAASAVTLTSGDSAGTVAGDGAMLNHCLVFKPSNGAMSMTWRAKLGAITSVAFFAGFTDTLALEGPIHSAASADTITTNATDAVGIFFDTSMATDNWWFASVKNDVDTTHQNLGIAPVADTYEVWKLDVSTDGHATLYRNGKAIKQILNAVTASVALTPVFIIFPRTTATKTAVIDYVAPSVKRV